MARVQEFLRRHHGDMDFRPAWESGARLANRRRLVVFTGVFVVLCVLSLAYTFLRAPQYRALTLLQITPGDLEERRDRGLVSARLGGTAAAARELEAYVSGSPRASDVEEVRALLRDLGGKRSLLN